MNEPAKRKFARGIIFGFGFPCKWIVAIFMGWPNATI
jgi:hypothetical protein